MLWPVQFYVDSRLNNWPNIATRSLRFRMIVRVYHGNARNITIHCPPEPCKKLVPFWCAETLNATLFVFVSKNVVRIWLNLWLAWQRKTVKVNLRSMRKGSEIATTALIFQFDFPTCQFLLRIFV